METLINEDKKIKTPLTFVCLTVCTCKRPKMLKEAIESVCRLKIPANIKAALVIVDNDEKGSALHVVEEMRQNLDIPVYYNIQKERGLAKARNKALETVMQLGASHILFFDDDEILDENCLEEHIKLYTDNPDAFISAGIVIRKFTEDLPSYITKHFVFKSKTTKQSGEIRPYCSTNNVLFPVSLTKDYNLWFSNDYIFTGGEDVDFFKRVCSLGFTIVWDNEAIVYELISKSKGNIKWILDRCYYNGNCGVILKFKENKEKNREYIFLLKQILIFFMDIIILFPSLLLGFGCFLNMLGICFKTKGKIDGIIKKTPIDYYKNIYGE